MRAARDLRRYVFLPRDRMSRGVGCRDDGECDGAPAPPPWLCGRSNLKGSGFSATAALDRSMLYRYGY